MLLKTTLRVLFVLAALLFLTDKATACTCAGLRDLDGYHPCMAYRRADAVFTGQVESIRRDIESWQHVVRFSVDEAYRGVQGRTVEVVTNPNTPSCGYPFKEGQRYFVYAQRAKNGKLTESLCGPTVRLGEATRDVSYARAAMAGEKGARIVGAVVKVERTSVKEYPKKSAMPHVRVTLERWNQPWETISRTVTDAEGRYEFKGVGVGEYRVRAMLPKPGWEWTPDGKSKEHRVSISEETNCESDSFIVTSDSSIRGRLVTPDGAPLPDQYMSLIPLDENRKEFSSMYTPTTNSFPGNGHYYFRDVPPGRYLVAINPSNRPAKSDPAYPLMYYPGVRTKPQATVIEVDGKREFILEDFKLPPPLKERWFSGTVLLADRSPAVGAKVILIDPNDRMMGTNVTEVIADAQGKFRVKGYESFPYWIDAYIISATQPRVIEMYAPPVQLSTIGSVEGIELLISLDRRDQPYHW